MKGKLTIELNEYMHSCGDGCCTHYGTITKVNGVEMKAHNQDTVTILAQVLNHLGYDVEIVETWEGEQDRYELPRTNKCPVCGGETTFEDPTKCMTEGCPNCIF